MKTSHTNSSLILALAVLACVNAAYAADKKMDKTVPPADHMMMQQSTMPAQIKLTQKATVVSSVDVPQYTYIEVSQNSKTRWLAGSTVAVKKGDTIQFDDGMDMHDFKSSTLNRTFPTITFVNRVEVGK